MSRLLLAAAVSLAAAPALAGGFSPVVVPAAPAAPVVPVAPVAAPSADWSGPYVGAQLGFGRLTLEDTFFDEDSAPPDDTESGQLLGVHAGYMFDFGRFVAGAELDWDRTNIESDYYDGAFSDFDDAPLELTSIARAKVRLGFDAGRALPYITAGVARASFDTEDPDNDDFEDSYDGRFVGVGVSFMATDRVMVGVEALRHEFEDAPYVDSDNSQVDTLTLRGSFRF